MSASAQQNYDIVTVGSGPVGAAFACALAESGLSVAIIDRGLVRQDVSPAGATALYDARVSAISPATRAILEMLDVWDDIDPYCCPYTNMHVWEADGTASIHFSATDIHALALGYIVENQVLLDSLHRSLAARQVDLIQGSVAALHPALAGSKPGMAVILEDHRRVTARLVVGADGATSKIRQLARFSVQERDYNHQAIVTTVRTALPHRATAIQRFMDSGVLAFLPLPDKGGASHAPQQHCSIVWSLVPEEAVRVMAMTDADFMGTLEQAIESQLGQIEWVDKRHSFPLRQRHASRYVQNHVALIGDAAHSIHPLAGLGVNLGFLDAWSLASHIHRAGRQERDFASLRILQRYERERRSNNLQVMWLMEAFKRLFADQPLLLRWLRNTGVRGLDSLPVLKNQIMQHAMGSLQKPLHLPSSSSILSARR